GLDMGNLCRQIANYELFQTAGSLRSATGILTCTLRAAVGDQCEIVIGPGRSVLAEVIGFTHGLAHIAAYELPDAVSPGMPVLGKAQGISIPIGAGLLGRVVDGLGRPIDGRGPISGCELRALRKLPPSPMERTRIA